MNPGAVFDSIRHVAAAAAMGKLPERGGKRFLEVFRHGSLQLEIFAPRGRDTQRPHIRDEVYFIIQGSGFFVSETQRFAFRRRRALRGGRGVAPLRGLQRRLLHLGLLLRAGRGREAPLTRAPRRQRPTGGLGLAAHPPVVSGLFSLSGTERRPRCAARRPAAGPGAGARDELAIHLRGLKSIPYRISRNKL